MEKILNEACECDPAFCPNGCGHSYKGLKRKNNLKKHMVYACGVSPQFKCSFCPKLLRYKHCLQYHVNVVHRQLNIV